MSLQNSRETSKWFASKFFKVSS